MASKPKVKVKCEDCQHEWLSAAKPENIKCPKCKSVNCKRDFKEDGFPQVSPQMGNMPPKPQSLRVCGNVIPVRGGKAAEADPKKLRRRAKERARSKGEKPDETRI